MKRETIKERAERSLAQWMDRDDMPDDVVEVFRAIFERDPERTDDDEDEDEHQCVNDIGAAASVLTLAEARRVLAVIGPPDDSVSE